MWMKLDLYDKRIQPKKYKDWSREGLGRRRIVGSRKLRLMAEYSRKIEIDRTGLEAWPYLKKKKKKKEQRARGSENVDDDMYVTGGVEVRDASGNRYFQTIPNPNNVRQEVEEDYYQKFSGKRTGSGSYVTFAEFQKLYTQNQKLRTNERVLLKDNLDLASFVKRSRNETAKILRQVKLLDRDNKRLSSMNRQLSSTNEEYLLIVEQLKEKLLARSSLQGRSKMGSKRSVRLEELNDRLLQQNAQLRKQLDQYSLRHAKDTGLIKRSNHSTTLLNQRVVSLEKSNRELRTINRELKSINKELKKSREVLLRNRDMQMTRMKSSNNSRKSLEQALQVSRAKVSTQRASIKRLIEKCDDMGILVEDYRKRKRFEESKRKQPNFEMNNLAKKILLLEKKVADLENSNFLLESAQREMEKRAKQYEKRHLQDASLLKQYRSESQKKQIVKSFSLF